MRIDCAAGVLRMVVWLAWNAPMNEPPGGGKALSVVTARSLPTWKPYVVPFSIVVYSLSPHNDVSVVIFTFSTFASTRYVAFVTLLTKPVGSDVGIIPEVSDGTSIVPLPLASAFAPQPHHWMSDRSGWLALNVAARAVCRSRMPGSCGGKLKNGSSSVLMIRWMSGSLDWGSFVVRAAWTMSARTEP